MRGQDDMSALMMAARSGVKELVGLLLERGKLCIVLYIILISSIAIRLGYCACSA
jgi:hypothetical protein